MCRLFGNSYNLDNQSVDSDVFKTLTLMSKSGGPDSTCYFEDNHVQFGFNRLSILDTSEQGNQPILSPSGRFVLMLNGEIYNFISLAKKYQLTQLRSGSDAEVVAHLTEILPFEKLLAELNGMFALVVWDKQTSNLFLARDFAGIKPLFYGQAPEGIVFASQFNQLVLHPWFRNWSWSKTGLREYLQFGFMPAPNTIAEGVFQLEPGTWLSYSVPTKDKKIYPYKRFFSNEGKPVLDETSSESIRSVRESIKDSIQRQLVSDVPLGVFLSGGIDSSLVASMASEIRPDIESITIGFETKKYDESEKAAAYAKHLGIKNRVTVLSDSELITIFSEHEKAMVEPLADYSSIPTYLVSKVAANDFKVMLSGDGGDELFWGYPRFRTFAKSAPLFSIPGTETRRIIKGVSRKMGFDITGFLTESSLGKAIMEFHSYMGSDFLNRIFPGSSLNSELIDSYKFKGKSRQEALLYLRRNEFYQHLQKILVKVDRASMANGLEVRVPLLDKVVIEAAEKINPQLCSKHDELKVILKRILEQYIPAGLIEKQKKGFTPPLRLWSKGILKDEIMDTIASMDFLNDIGINKGVMKELSEDYMNSKHDNLLGIWTLYVLEKWRRNNQSIS